MQKSIQHLESELAKVRAGKATPAGGDVRIAFRGFFGWNDILDRTVGRVARDMAEAFDRQMFNYTERPVRPTTTEAVAPAEAVASYMGHDAGRTGPIRGVVQPVRPSQPDEEVAGGTVTEGSEGAVPEDPDAD